MARRWDAPLLVAERQLAAAQDLEVPSPIGADEAGVTPQGVGFEVAEQGHDLLAGQVKSRVRRLVRRSIESHSLVPRLW